MDRREFNKLAGLTLLALGMPALPAGKDDMEFSRLLEKLGRGQRLTDSELFELRNHARNIEETTNLAKGWVTQGTSTPIFQSPIESIYSQVLAGDAASVAIPVPNKYRHLVLFCAGRNTDPGTSVEYLLARMNGDGEQNYSTQKIFATGSTISAQSDTSQRQMIVGGLVQDGAAANETCGSVTFIPHYTSSLAKRAISMFSPFVNYLVFTGATWSGTDPITSMTIFSSDSGTPNDIKAGSIISVYGVL